MGAQGAFLALHDLTIYKDTPRFPAIRAKSLCTVLPSYFKFSRIKSFPRQLRAVVLESLVSRLLIKTQEIVKDSR